MMLCLCIWAQAQFPSNGLINRFTFNSTLAGTNGHTLSGIASAAYSTDRNNAASSALNILSSSQASSSAGIPNLPGGSSARTVTFWYKSNAQTIHSLFNYGSPSACYALAYDGSIGRLIFFNGTTELTINRPYSTNWVHVAACYTGTNILVYVNGVLALNNAISVNTGSNPVSKIGYSPGNAYFGSFQIDDLAIYNRALSAAEITGIYTGVCNPVPVNTTPVQNLTICAGQSTTLSVNGKRSINWYTVPTGGTAIDTGLQFTTPVLQETDTFYAESDTAGCVSARLAIVVNVTPLINPNPPTLVSDLSVPACSGSRVLLQAQSNQGIIRWYNTSSGGTLLDTGSYFFTPELTTNTTFYAEVSTGCGPQSISSRIPVSLQVNGNSDLVNTTPAYLLYACKRVFAHPTDLSVETSANPSSIFWQLGKNILGSGKNFRTPGISSDTVFWVTAKSSCLSSLAIQVKSFDWVSGFTPSNLTQTGSTPLCPGDTVSVKASNIDQVPLIWYSTTDQVLGWGDSARLVLPRNGTFLVRRGSGACASSATTVQFPVNTVPLASISLANDSIRALNSFDSYTLYRNGEVIASGNAGGTFAIPASCGTYQASFTNTTNTCGNVTAMARRTQIPAGSGAGCYYYDFQSFTNLQYPAFWSWSLNGQPGTPNVPINASGVTSTTNWICPSSGTLNIRIRSANGCEFTGSIQVQNLTSIYNNVPGGFVGIDTLTSCVLKSNVITVSSMTSGVGVSGSTQVCYQNSTLFTASTNRPGSIHWFNSPTSNTPIFVGDTLRTPILDTTTTFYYARNFEGCSSPKTARTVTVNPEIKVQLTPSDTTICSGKAVAFTANTVNFSTYSWQSKHHGNRSGGTSWLLNPVQTDTIRLQISNNGCSNSASSIVKVNANTLFVHTLRSCFGKPVVFRGDTIRNPGDYEFQLPNALGCDSTILLTVIFSNQLQQVVNASICNGQSYRFNNRDISAAGTYRDTLVASGGCDSVVVLNLEVKPLPQPSIVQNGAELSTQVFASYQWKLNNLDIPGAVSRTFMAQQTGSYRVRVSDNSNCSNLSEPFELNTVGLQGMGPNGFSFGLFPNPARDEIRLSGLPDSCPIQVYDLMGKLHYSGKTSGQEPTILVQDFKDGVYVLVAEVAGQKIRKQFVITR